MGSAEPEVVSDVKSRVQWKPLLASFFSGMVFGTAFQRSRVNEPMFVSSQFTFTHFVMLKMFLAASGTSVLVLSFLPRVFPSVAAPIQRQRNIMVRAIGEERGLLALIGGGALLGVAMQQCGSCPGTIFSQWNSPAFVPLFVGCVVGSYAFALLNDWHPVKAFLHAAKCKFQLHTLQGLLNGDSEDSNASSPSASTAVLFSAALFSVVAALEYFVPWRSDISMLPARTVAGSIPPSVAGLMVGLLQVPLMLAAGQHLGTSSAYLTMAANACSFLPFGKKNNDNTPSYLPSLCKALFTNYWQVALCGGIVAGSYLSGALSDPSVYTSTTPLGSKSPLAFVASGAALVLGARTAAGCTSGHGISGMGYFALNSFVVVASMFGAAIAAAFLL